MIRHGAPMIDRRLKRRQGRAAEERGAMNDEAKADGADGRYSERKEDSMDNVNTDPDVPGPDELARRSGLIDRAVDLMKGEGPDASYKGEGGIASCIEFAERVGTSLPAGNPAKGILAEVAAAKAELTWLRARAKLAEDMEDDGRRRG